MSARGTTALDDVATLGGPFVVRTGPPPGPAGDGIVAVGDLTVDVARLRTLVVEAREQLGTREDRVAASWVFTGIAARLLAPSLASVVLHRWVPALDELRWCPDADPRLWSPGTGHAGAEAGVLRAELVATVGRLVAALRAGTPVAAGLLWGEVAASAVKAQRLLTRRRPEPAVIARAAGTVAALLGRAPLAPVVTPTYARRTCCLAYRVPGGHTCADCVLGASIPGSEVLRGTRP